MVMGVKRYRKWGLIVEIVKPVSLRSKLFRLCGGPNAGLEEPVDAYRRGALFILVHRFLFCSAAKATNGRGGGGVVVTHRE